MRLFIFFPEYFSGDFYDKKIDIFTKSFRGGEVIHKLLPRNKIRTAIWILTRMIYDLSNFWSLWVMAFMFLLISAALGRTAYWMIVLTDETATLAHRIEKIGKKYQKNRVKKKGAFFGRKKKFSRKPKFDEKIIYRHFN